jgi:OTU domain-containing protein 6
VDHSISFLLKRKKTKLQDMIAKEELESAHKKALKVLEGELRAAVKKAKGTKGKKAKQAIALAEEEFAARLSTLQEEHEQKLKCFSGEENEAESPQTAETNPISEPEEQTPELSAKERKLLKARRKKERQKEREIQLQEELEREAANAGPSLRDVELEQIQAVLTPLNLAVDEVEADGHCLYRAVAAQAATDFQEMRKIFF